MDYVLLRIRSFHTTQYDLNVITINPTHITKNGFHTTQYDLNPEVCYARNGQLSRFPYYIVRFKLVRVMCIMSCPSPFPYYIVRFKLADARAKKKEDDSFHTTQYDLNEHSRSTKISDLLCFHTTQYDLNLTRLIPKKRKNTVSILHSTI